MMKCVNKNVLIGGAVVAAGVLVLKPAWAVAAFPLLLLALCPLSMILMMRGMSGGTHSASPTSFHSHTGPTPAPAADSQMHRQMADLQEEVRILRAELVRQQSDESAVPPPVDLGKRDQPGPRP